MKKSPRRVLVQVNIIEYCFKWTDQMACVTDDHVYAFPKLITL